MRFSGYERKLVFSSERAFSGAFRAVFWLCKEKKNSKTAAFGFPAWHFLRAAISLFPPDASWREAFGKSRFAGALFNHDLRGFAQSRFARALLNHDLRGLCSMNEILCIALVTAAVGYILSAMGFGGTRLFLVFSATVIFTLAVGRVGELIGEIASFIPSGVGELGSSLIRALGIGYIGGFFSDSCRELGAVGAADALSLFTRAELAMLALPHLLRVISLAGELL